MEIKICGLKYRDNIEAIALQKPDYMGFIFYTGSKRYVNGCIDKTFFKSINKSIKKVGVFVNADRDEILEIASFYNLDLLQLHGDESPEYCEYLHNKIPIIKAFGIDEDFEWKILKDYEAYCDYFLFDTKTITYGGSGKSFDKKILKNYTLNKPIFLSGGLDVDNLDEIAELENLPIAVVDLNSKLEIEPGLKDINKTGQAILKVRNSL